MRKFRGMHVIYTIGILLLVAVFPISNELFTPETAYRGGSGSLDPGDIRVVKFETDGGYVKGNVSVDLAPVKVWIIPHAGYESQEIFQTGQAIFSSVGLLHEFQFDYTNERNLVLIIINNCNETQHYEYSIEYEGPLNWEGGLLSLGPLGLIVLAIPIAVAIIFLKKRGNENSQFSFAPSF